MQDSVLTRVVYQRPASTTSSVCKRKASANDDELD